MLLPWPSVNILLFFFKKNVIIISTKQKTKKHRKQKARKTDKSALRLVPERKVTTAMDHYNEQMIRKQAQLPDIALRIVIVAAGLLVVMVSAYFAFLISPLLILISAGAAYFAYILFCNTYVEYEYIVTNNDLDIDKISGKRKRKRLITVKLNTVRQWGEYTGKEGGDAGHTVMASDNTGDDEWYILADHAKLGKIKVIFTPTKKTITNINHGVPHGVRKKLKFEEKPNVSEKTE